MLIIVINAKRLLREEGLDNCPETIEGQLRLWNSHCSSILHSVLKGTAENLFFFIHGT